MRLTARGRLTALYTALVLAAGVVLTALTYLLVRRSLRHRIRIEVLAGPGTDTESPPNVGEMTALAERVRATTLSDLLTRAGIALAVVTVLAAALGWLVAGRVLQPIRAIAATAQRLSAENLSERVPVGTPPDELGDLAATINGMLDRIRAGVAQRDRILAGQRLFTANAAHELRTPLTTIRTAIDVTLDGEPDRAELLAMADDIRAAIDHSRRTLDGLLALARSESDPGRHRLVDLAEIATGILDGAADAASARRLTCRVAGRPARMYGEPVLLERLIGNLVDNAVRYNHVDGRITVHTDRIGDHVLLRVTNTGPSILREDATGLLEPFVRGRDTRRSADGGAGLGLSIVRAISTVHQGDLTLTARDGGGLDVTIRFPSAREAHADGPRLVGGTDVDARSEVADARSGVADRPV
ncbi:sensor histidine kinase [Embleya hyalina]|uniref:histidine kinase n=1 Tax=Embleya hyalina TaxID=516124 RepID=A0A401Z020_9ACTN|nr:HAMP domain-containing sensor histidine kinase [Embleya hyalina]GCE00158.1 two-component sensor histidine kinase [Embleya hyalina]